MDLTKEQLKEGLSITEEKLKEKDQKLLYLAVSGSHSWGLDREDSDVDLRGIYQDSTLKTLGLHKGRDTVEFSQDTYDVQLYEIEKFLNMLCKHNGNMVNLLWLPKPIRAVAYIPWQSLSWNFMTRKLRLYYRGYAESQRKRAMSQRGGKALIYTYREMFSGLYAMHYGKMEHNFLELWNEAKTQNWYSKGLLDKYFPNPTHEVSDEGWHQFYSEWEELCTKLDEEAENSLLPENYDGLVPCNTILQSLRLMDLDRKRYGEV